MKCFLLIVTSTGIPGKQTFSRYLQFNPIAPIEMVFNEQIAIMSQFILPWKTYWIAYVTNLQYLM